MARLHTIVKSVSSLFQALKYGSKDGESGGKERKEKKVSKSSKKSHQPLNKQLSSSEGALNSRSVQSNNAYNQSQATHNRISNYSQSKSVSDVPKLVAHVIEEAAVSTPSFRQPIRVLNGLRPSLQSQVLLNTSTSQPFEELVKDLAKSVRIPQQPIGNALQTLAGRQIRSYSQLRSELRAGQRTFYVCTYPTAEPVMLTTAPVRDSRYIRNKNGKAMVKTTLGKVDSNSSSDLTPDNEERIRRKSHAHKRSRSHPENLNINEDSGFIDSRSPTPHD